MEWIFERGIARLNLLCYWRSSELYLYKKDKKRNLIGSSTGYDRFTIKEDSEMEKE